MTLPQPPAPQLTTCYRHPGREAGRRCTRCGRPACSECLVRADIGSQCVECAKAAKPDVRTRARYWNARQPTLVTYALIAINLAVFLWIGIQDPDSLSRTGFSADQRDLASASTTSPSVDEWYRLVSSGFLHFGFLHIALNMLLLFQLGQMLEPELGRVRFALLYFAALLEQWFSLRAAGRLRIAVPWRLSSSRRNKIRAPMSWSMLPVGSSATRRRGPIDDGPRNRHRAARRRRGSAGREWVLSPRRPMRAVGPASPEILVGDPRDAQGSATLSKAERCWSSRKS